MRNPAGWFVGLAAGVAVSSASVAQAEPVALADQDMDAVTAGFVGDGILDISPADALPDLVPDHAIAPGHAFSAHEVVTVRQVSPDGSARTEVVISQSYFVDN